MRWRGGASAGAENLGLGSCSSSAWGTDTTHIERTQSRVAACLTQGDTALASRPNVEEAVELDINDVLERAKLRYNQSFTVGASRKVHRYVSIHGGNWGSIVEYLTWNIPRKYRVILTRFRVGAHRLEVEVGRHNKIEYQRRLCKYCKSIGVEHVEDEAHFLFDCPLYDDIRNNYQKCYNGISRNLFSIFCSKSGDLLASLIHSLFSKRDAFLQPHLQQSSETVLAP